MQGSPGALTSMAACKQDSKNIIRRQPSHYMQKLMSDALTLGKRDASAMLENLAQALPMTAVSRPSKKGLSSSSISQSFPLKHTSTKSHKFLEILSYNLQFIWHKAMLMTQAMNCYDGFDASFVFTSASLFSTAFKLHLLSWFSPNLVPSLYLPVKSCPSKAVAHQSLSVTKPTIHPAASVRPDCVKEPSATVLALAQEIAENSAIGWSGFLRPVDKVWEVSSNFGPRWERHHNGVDLAAPAGEPVLAADSGEVTYAGWESGGYGNLVEITHIDGWTTLYAHNTEIYTWKGDIVRRGQCIASVGETGRATGPHLHWEIRNQHGSPVDPALYVDL